MDRNDFEFFMTDPLFKNLGSEMIKGWKEGGKLRIIEMSKGDTLMTDDSINKCLVIILKGCVTVSKKNAAGKDVIINYLGEKSVFGMASLFSDSESFPSIMTCRQRSRLAVVPRSLIEEAFEENPRFAKAYAGLLTEKILFLNQKLSTYTENDTGDKVLRWISRACGDSARFEIPCSISHLAETLGMGRASLYRALDRFEKEGIIHRNGTEIFILKPEKLV